MEENSGAIYVMLGRGFGINIRKSALKYILIRRCRGGKVDLSAKTAHRPLQKYTFYYHLTLIVTQT
jgi:hypothetical protein